MKTYPAFEYDYNCGHGQVVIHKSVKGDISAGDKIILVSIEGNKREEDYDGFGSLVTVTGFKEAYDKNYFIVRTDLRS